MRKIAERLRFIADAENISISDEAVRESLAPATAQCAMRSRLSIRSLVCGR